ncbi:DUF6215 domain-containing protein [Streptomyces sp. NBC_00289]|uniref:DUF6215 domain-containing protein n=1 Tax=Streptomyces sp. NBC_00289 TaxID=2975703 RepID=UPI003256623E
MARQPLRNAARATRAVASGTDGAGTGRSDIAAPPCLPARWNRTPPDCPTKQDHQAQSPDPPTKSFSRGRSHTPEGTVQLDTYTVKLSRSYDDLPVAGMADLLDDAETKKIQDHPAVLCSSPTIAIRFNLGGGKSDTGPGGIARTLLVAPDTKDGGGSYELAIWRQDDVRPDDTALLRIAHEVLPTIPGWTTAR